MNQAERTQARALAQCKFTPDSFDQSFCTGLAWCAEHASKRALTKKQKYLLATLVHRYRHQLAGKLDPELMRAEPPSLSEFGLDDQRNTVKDLFTGKASHPHASAAR